MSVFVYKGPQALSIFVYTYLIIQELLYIPAKIAGVFFTGLYFFVDGLSVIGQIVLGVIKSIFFKEEKNDYSYIDFEEDLY